MFKVKCRDCGKRHEIKPDGLGRLTPNLIHWELTMGGSCCRKTGGRKRERAQGIAHCCKCGKPAVVMTQEGPGLFGLVNYCRDCFMTKFEAEKEAKAKQ